ncbi:MAG: hypothetical protein JO314_00915 [Acidobacteria bacterium]|nr:hypothetical protein [Acidobacteriota bacterium]
MKTLTIKNVPDEVYRSLAESAKINRRSLNNEALIRLESGLDELQDEDDLVADIERFRESLPKTLWVTDEDLRESRKELERRTERSFKSAQTGAKTSVRVR